MGHLSEKDYQRAASSAWPFLEWRLDQITSGGPFEPKFFYGYLPVSMMTAYIWKEGSHAHPAPTGESFMPGKFLLRKNNKRNIYLMQK